jgi:polar amino acid transport system permease protein
VRLVVASFDWHLFWAALSSHPYWRGALTALSVTAAALPTALVIGFFVALGSLSKRRGPRMVSWTYNWLFRATPTLLQLYFVWYALPTWWHGFAASWFTPFMAAWITLSLNEAAYASEIIRAGLLSVDPGQELAGRALGMSRRRILQRIVVPQAVRIAIPPIGNEFITLLKLTSLASIISLHELLTAATELTSAKFVYNEPLLAALVYYLVIVSILMVLQSRLERRFTWTSRRRRVRVSAPAVPAIPHDAR